MIKAIIFDCFGVLTTEAFHAFRSEFFADSAQKRSQANQAMDELNAASIPYEEFLARLAKLSGISKEEVKKYLSSSQPNKPLLEYVKGDLKPEYKIGMLSNAGANWLDQLFGKEGAALFDDAVLSYEEGILKPEPEIYKIAADRLEVAPDECIFIDDNSGHCEGARHAGMNAVWYQDFHQMKKELRDILTASSDH